jgi:hypothetical protein
MGVKKLIFKSVDLTSVDVFNSAQQLLLCDSLNLIMGPPGSGKTAIAKQLLSIFRSNYNYGKVPLEIATRLCFIKGVYCWDLQASDITISDVMDHVPGVHQQDFNEALSAHVNRLITPKVESGYSKFGGPGDTKLPFRLTVSHNNRYQIQDSAGGDMSHYFLATGERTVLSLATNLAFRNVLEFNEPLVINGMLGYVDDLSSPAFFDVLTNHNGQCVILDSDTVFRGVGAEPDFYLVQRGEDGGDVVVVRA